MRVSDEIRRQRFAEELRRLRTTRPYFFDDDPLNEYTQQALSIRCGTDPETGKPNVPVRTIQNIEQAKSVNLTHVLGFIADALRLYGTERAAFFHLALTGEYGSYPPPGTQKPSTGTLQGLKEDLEMITYPAMVRTPLWDIIYMTAEHRALWNITSDSEKLLRNNEAGANLMVLRFHEDFQNINTQDRNRISGIEDILSFQMSSRGYRNTKRYRELMHHLMQIESFEIAWTQAEAYSIEDIMTRKRTRKPKYHLLHPEFGALSITSYRWNSVFGSSGLITSTYIPFAGSEEKFEQICKNSKTYLKVTEFPYVDFHELADNSDDDTEPDDKAAV